MEFIDQHQAGAGVRADADDGFHDVGDVGTAPERKAEEPGELRRDHARGRGRWDGDVEDRDSAADVRVSGSVQEFVGPSELGDGNGLPGAGRPGDDQPPAGADRVFVEQDQATPAGDGVTDRGGRDDLQPGVMIETVLVITQPLRRRQQPVLVLAQERGWRRRLGYEAAPSLQRRELVTGLVLVRVRDGVVGYVARRNHVRLHGSSSGLNSPSGITSASDSALSSSVGGSGLVTDAAGAGAGTAA
ncbi:hypothetical protein GA0115241_1101156 [Streptomyces sp. DpondAA-D4]|nr:hypothetical protein GA0115241_1101156 [Streptomyces sp. DpondAA-D4]